MSFHKILIEPAKTSRGKCKKCGKMVEKGHLKIQVADDRKFNEYIRRNGGRSVFHGQGMSRGGYIETPEGVISIERYWVHLNCYTPIHSHPWEKQWFRMEKFSASQKADFNRWLGLKAAGRATPVPATSSIVQPAGKKKKAIKKASKRKVKK